MEHVAVATIAVTGTAAMIAATETAALTGKIAAIAAVAESAVLARQRREALLVSLFASLLAQLLASLLASSNSVYVNICKSTWCLIGSTSDRVAFVPQGLLDSELSPSDHSGWHAVVQ